MTIKPTSNIEKNHTANNSLNTVDSIERLAPLVVTTGEPAGIGMDIVLNLAMDGTLATLKRPVIVLANQHALQQRAIEIYDEVDALLWRTIATADELLTAESLQHAFDSVLTDYTLNNNGTASDKQSQAAFLVIDVACYEAVRAGELNINNAQMVMTQLQLSHQLAITNGVAAIVTGPLQKSVLIDAGLTLTDGTMFTGHTEFFMQQSGCDKVVMMLANNAMKVALVTTHLPLREVADAVTASNVRKTVRIVLDDLRDKFGLQHPKVLVCGLNPHAGEGGHLGKEENEIINPVLREFQAQNVDISSAMPADTLFTTRHLQHCDAVIAMYHDQGLPVLKSHGFGDTVNLTLGLPYIRTSVDHGTALDLAGNKKGAGQASPTSLWQALTMAESMAKTHMQDSPAAST